MKIVNTLFATSKGGLEQVFVDYAHALNLQGHEVHMVCQPSIPYLRQLAEIPVALHFLRNRGSWDVHCATKLHHLLKQIAPDAVIAHGNRSLSMLTMRGLRPSCTLVGTAQNFQTKRFTHVDVALATTPQLAEHVQKTSSLPPEKIRCVRNMVHLPKYRVARPAWQNPPIIGAMGRFVHKKGFHLFLDALAQLQAQGIAFQAMLAGDGECKRALKKQADALALGELFDFIGWVEEPSDFYNAIDIFCLPSTHEPFGLVLLEALSYQLPVVSTDTEGPNDFLRDGENALVVPKGDASALAQGLRRLLRDHALADRLAVAGMYMVRERFVVGPFSRNLSTALEELICQTSSFSRAA